METTPSIVTQKINDCVDYIKNMAQSSAEEIGWFAANRIFLENLGKLPYVSAYSVTWYNLEHTEVIKVIRHFGGKFTKSYEDETVNYERTVEVDNRAIRLNGSQPPASCKIIEEWADIPAQPATRKLVKKLQCKEPVLPDNFGVPESPVTPPDLAPMSAGVVDEPSPLYPGFSVPPNVSKPSEEPIVATSPTLSTEDVCRGDNS